MRIYSRMWRKPRKREPSRDSGVPACGAGGSSWRMAFHLACNKMHGYIDMWRKPRKREPSRDSGIPACGAGGSSWRMEEIDYLVYKFLNQITEEGVLPSSDVANIK